MTDRVLQQPDRLADTTGALLAAVRNNGPLVQCITNIVVANFTANTLLALRAAPAMVDITGEAGLFAGVADGVLINLGTPSAEQREAMREAAAGANQAGTPWVLDPVAIGALPVRTDLAVDLIRFRPTAVRGNASEILALAGAGSGGRGVDATDSTATAATAAITFAREHDNVIAVSGPEDLITDGTVTVRVANGDALLTRMTGGGCALGSVIAAVLAVRGQISTLDATASAHAIYGIAAERGARGAAGPGSFAVRFLDALASLSPEEAVAAARVRTEHASTQEPNGACP